MTERKGVFVREATGLVKEVDRKSVTVYNYVSNGIPMVASAIVLAQVPFMFPQADYVLGWVITAIGLSFNALIYAMLTSSMPRSGGEYVFLSRIVSPPVGFAVNFAWVFWIMTWLAWNAVFGISVVSTFSTVVASLTGNKGIVDAVSVMWSAPGQIAVGTAIILLCFVLGIIPIKRTMLVIFVSVVLGTIISLIGIAMFLPATPESFRGLFNHYMTAYSTSPDPYQEVLDLARNAGYGGAKSPTLQGTLPMVALMVMYASAPIYSTYLAGEIKKGSQLKTHVVSMLFGGLLTISLLHIILWILMAKVVTPEFIGASAYLYFSGGSTIPTTPFYFLFAYILAGNNLPLVTLLFVGYLLLIYHVPVQNIIMPTRCMFAWSFDRLLPAKISEVSERFRTPVWTVVISVVVGYIFFIWMVTEPMSFIMLGTPAAFSIIIMFAAVAVAGILFPYRNREIFNASPARFKVGSIPLISILGIISLGFMIWAFSMFFLNPGMTGYTSTSWIIIALLYGGAIAYYYLAAWYRRRQGIDIHLAFGQVPPE